MLILLFSAQMKKVRIEWRVVRPEVRCSSTSCWVQGRGCAVMGDEQRGQEFDGFGDLLFRRAFRPSGLLRIRAWLQKPAPPEVIEAAHRHDDEDD